MLCVYLILSLLCPCFAFAAPLDFIYENYEIFLQNDFSYFTADIQSDDPEIHMNAVRTSLLSQFDLNICGNWHFNLKGRKLDIASSLRMLRVYV